MGTDVAVIIMLVALLTMLAALVWWDGSPRADESPAEPVLIDADGGPRR